MATNRIFGFDIARAISMFYIVGLLHLTEYTDFALIHDTSCQSLTWSTLGVFTWLSGYLLASRYSFSDRQDITIFLKKRVLRFYPLFFISSILLCLIHFNNWDETWKGLIGLSPFWAPQPRTLWYVAMLIILYLATPALCYKNLRIGGRLVIATVLPIIALIIQNLFHSVDLRFFYYYTVYVFGLFSALYGQERVTKILQSKWSAISLVVYLPLMFVLQYTTNRLLMMGVGYMGIFVILNVCILLGNFLNTHKLFFQIISFLSFGSMCSYLFHREIYWLFLKIYDPMTNWGIFCYLFFLALPTVLVSTYYIQKIYDGLVRKI